MLMDFISIFVDVITCVGVFIAIHSFFLTRKATIAEYERTKKLSTFNILKEYETKFHKYNDIIYKKCGNNKICYNEIIEDKKLEKVVWNYLNDLEFICTGVNIGIYDLDTLDRLFGDVIIKTFNQFISYVEERRKQGDSLIIYVELEQVVNGINRIHSENQNDINKNADIKHGF